MSEQTTERRTKVTLTEAGYAALGAGEAAVEFIRDLPNQWPQRLQYLREELPAAVRKEYTRLANRGRRLTGQIASSSEAQAARGKFSSTKEAANATVTGVRRTAEAERDLTTKAADAKTDPAS